MKRTEVGFNRGGLRIPDFPLLLEPVKKCTNRPWGGEKVDCQKKNCKKEGEESVGRLSAALRGGVSSRRSGMS